MQLSQHLCLSPILWLLKASDQQSIPFSEQVKKFMQMELKKFTTEEVERSQVLQAPGAERRSRRELFEALRRELQ